MDVYDARGGGSDKEEGGTSKFSWSHDKEIHLVARCLHCSSR